MADDADTAIHADLLIRDGRIAALLPPASVVEECETLDATGMLILPGFVDTHRHTWQTQLRTVAADWTLFDYLVRMRSLYSGLYGAEDARLGNLAGAWESLDAGITTIVDHCHLINSPDHADALLDGLQATGIRGVFCYGFFVNPRHDPPSIEPGPGWRYDDARRLRRERLSGDDGLIRFGIAPQEPEAIASDLLCAEIGIARELGARTISMHVAMGNYDPGNHVVGMLAGRGLLGPDMLFVHGAALTDDELAAMAAAGAGLSVTPETEMQMGMGFPAAFRARDTGVRTSLGVDIVSNYAADLILQARLALQSARAVENHQLASRRKAPRRLRQTCREALRLTTMGGAEALHLERDIGSIEPGKAADIILIRADGLHMTPSIDDMAMVILGASARDVDTVIVDGVIRKRAGQLVGVDVQALRAQLTASAAEIQARYAELDHGHAEAIWASILPNLA
jgi:cytosine/adenosine deaminase-related metal-dependent hydrolase